MFLTASYKHNITVINGRLNLYGNQQVYIKKKHDKLVILQYTQLSDTIR